MIATELLSSQLNQAQALPSLNKNQDDEQLKKACADFEAVFTGMMFKTMQKAIPKDPDSIHGGFAQDVFMDMFIDEISKISAEQQSNGIANMLYQELSRSTTVVPEAGKHTQLSQGISAYQGQQKDELQNLQNVLQPYRNQLIESARKNSLSPALLGAVMVAESAGDSTAQSSAGALGLMQLMPETADSLGVIDPLDPAQNIEGGARYLQMMLERFGSQDEALAAYNAGPSAVERWNGIPPYQETQQYVKKVNHLFRKIEKIPEFKKEEADLKNNKPSLTSPHASSFLSSAEKK